MESTTTDKNGNFYFKKVPPANYEFRTDVVGSRLKGAVNTGELYAREEGEFNYIINLEPNFKEIPVIEQESLIAEDKLLGGKESQVKITLKGPNNLEKGQVGFYVLTVTTKNFRKDKLVGELPNILDGQVIMASNEKAAVHPQWADLQVSDGKVWRKYYQPEGLGDLAGSGVFSLLGSLGTAGPLATAIDLGDEALEKITDYYALGAPAGEMAEVYIDENNYDQWEMPWRFTEYIPLAEDYVDGVRAVYPIYFETAGTHELNFYTGFQLAPSSNLLESKSILDSVLISTIANNSAVLVGRHYSTEVEVKDD